MNPGLILPTAGVDFDLTPRCKMFNNMNVLFFDSTNVLEHFLFDGRINKFIGIDLSTGIEYRPLLSENISILIGASVLLPGDGFRDLYNNYNDRVPPLGATFINLNLAF